MLNTGNSICLKGTGGHVILLPVFPRCAVRDDLDSHFSIQRLRLKVSSNIVSRDQHVKAESAGPVNPRSCQKKPGPGSEPRQLFDVKFIRVFGMYGFIPPESDFEAQGAYP